MDKERLIWLGALALGSGAVVTAVAVKAKQSSTTSTTGTFVRPPGQVNVNSPLPTPGQPNPISNTPGGTVTPGTPGGTATPGTSGGTVTPGTPGQPFVPITVNHPPPINLPITNPGAPAGSTGGTQTPPITSPTQTITLATGHDSSYTVVLEPGQSLWITLPPGIGSWFSGGFGPLNNEINSPVITSPPMPGGSNAVVVPNQGAGKTVGFVLGWNEFNFAASGSGIIRQAAINITSK